MKRIFWIPFILLAFMLPTGTAISGGGDGGGYAVDVLIEADMIPSGFKPLSKSEQTLGKILSDYYREAICGGESIVCPGAREAGDNTPLPGRIQLISINHETVDTDDNGYWETEFNEYLKGHLKEVITDFDKKEDFNARVARLRSELSPENAERIKGLDKQGLKDFVAYSEGEVSIEEALIIKEMIGEEESDAFGQGSDMVAESDFIMVGPDGEEMTQAEALVKLTMIGAIAEAYKDNPERQKEMVNAILNFKTD